MCAPLRFVLTLSGGSLVIAAASLLVLDAAPTYDPWAWLVWGRELWSWSLSTAEGPAFKPLPVAVCALLAGLGEGAPDAWVVVARAGAIAAVVLAGVAAWSLSDDGAPAGRPAAAVFAGLAVLLTAGFVQLSAAGSSEGLLLALLLGALLAVGGGRWGWAWGLLGLAALIRVEVWPLAAAVALWRWRDAGRGERWSLAAGSLAVLAAWFVPEWLGSGDALRSGARALQPNPGQPALASIPALASLGQAALLLWWPAAVGVAVLVIGRARAALAPAAVGAVWVLLVAAMAQAGFSGEGRYALVGVSLVAVSGAIGLGRAFSAVAARGALGVGVLAVIGGMLAVGAGPRLQGLTRDRDALRHQAELRHGLARTVAAAGGAAALRRCGPVVTGRYRGTLVAWHLRLPKHRVGFVASERSVVLASRLRRGAAIEPAPPRGGRVIVRDGGWVIGRPCLRERPRSGRRARRR